MIETVLKQGLEVLKLAPRYLVALGLTLGILILAPDEYIQRLGVSDLAKDYRQVIGISFILCVALLLVSGASGLWYAGFNWVRQWQFKRKLSKRLSRLTEDEKQILRYYISQNTRSNRLRIDDGVVQGLAGSGVIFLSATMGNALEGFAHNINEIAWDMLHENPALLIGSTNTYRTDKRDYW